MKYVVSWETRANESEDLQARSLQVFGSWSPPEGVHFTEFVGRVDGRGGFAVAETDDSALIARDMAIFGAFFDMAVHLVLDVQESARIAGQAIEYRRSVG